VIKAMRISDMIEDFIKEMFSEEDFIEIQRNDLAQHFNCVPSQINYVIATRFNPSQGYYVESKRGGGGHIKIKKINITKSNYLMHAISSIGEKITSQEVDIFISNFLSEDIVSSLEAKLLKVATSDNVLTIPQEYRDTLRANIFKNMLVNLVED
jgi:transcriptional regulator CtsR